MAGPLTHTRILNRTLQRVPRPHHPAQVIIIAFALMIAIGTALLLLPFASEEPGGTSVVAALFTATSAVCVTGLIVVDTPEHWSAFGEGVILALIQVGGFGIMTMASLLVVLVSRHMGLRSRLNAAAETKSFGIGDIRDVALGVVKLSIVFEVILAVILTTRLAVTYDESLPEAIWNGVFHAVSAFNNAGFSLYSDSLMRFVNDWAICFPISVAVICGGLGFPVLRELQRRLLKPRFWSLHTKITVSTTVVLLSSGTLFILASEWGNPATLGALDGPGRLLASFVHSVMPRSGGFNTLDVSAMDQATWLGIDVLMFIGGGSASTAGGIKVTTFTLLFFVIVAEIRAENDVNIFDRRVGARVQRQALSVALLAVAAVVVPTVVIAEFTTFSIDQILFEVISAFAVVGLSTGITADLPAASQITLTALMFIGRLGPITFATALALRHRRRLYELPESRPIIG